MEKYIRVVSLIFLFLGLTLAQTHTVNINCTSGGSTNPVGPVSVNQGGNLDIQISVDPEYEIFEIKVNDVLQPNTELLKLLNVTTAQNVEIAFKRKEDRWQKVGDNLIYNVENGVVGIGTSTPDPNYKLSVNGKVRTKEVKITPEGWADFVFDEDYKLATLEEVEAFIKKHKHLKDIPSAKEVEENGVELGKINAKLLQKIEELTLYVIEQDKLITEQENIIKKLLSERKN